MRKFKIMPIALLLNDNKAHSHGEIINEDQLCSDADELINGGFIEEVVEPAKTAAQIKAEKKAADDLKAKEDQEAADALKAEQAAKDKELDDAKAKEDADAAETLKLQQEQEAADALKNTDTGKTPGLNPEDILKK